MELKKKNKANREEWEKQQLATLKKKYETK